MISAFSSNAALVIGLIPDNIGKVGVLITTITAIVILNVQIKNYFVSKKALEIKIKEEILKDIEIEHARHSLEADRRTHARRTEDEVK